MAKGYATSSHNLWGSCSGPPQPLSKEHVHQLGAESFQNEVHKTPWKQQGVTEVYEMIFAYLQNFTSLLAIKNNRNEAILP